MNPLKRKKIFRMSLRTKQPEQSQEEVVEQKVEIPVVVEPVAEEVVQEPVAEIVVFEPVVEVKATKKKKSV